MNWSCCHHLGFTPPCFFIFFIFLQKRAKKIHLPATFRKQNLLFFVPRISFFRRLHTRPSDALLRYSIVDVLNNTNKKKKESKKGPRKREREREFGRIVRRPSSSSSSLFIITREEERAYI